MLKDPISGMPVVVVESVMLEKIIPKGIIDNLNNILGGDKENILSKEEQEYLPKFRLIPFTSLGKQNRIIIRVSCR